MRAFPRTIFALFLIGGFAAPAKADTVYTYTGDTFMFAQGAYAPGDRITGSFVLSGSFVPIIEIGPQSVAGFVKSYSFTDGHQTLTQANSTATFRVPFDFNGFPIDPDNTLGWQIDLRSLAAGISTDAGPYLGGDYIMYTWTGAAANPIVWNCAGGSPFPIECHFDPAISVALINATGPSNIYGGLPGTWAMQIPEGGSTALFLLAGLTILTPFIGLKRATRGL
jgi:hypothetical protein